MSEQLQQMQEILQKSLIKIKKLELELAQAKENTTAPNEAIAIIGTGVRLAGNITSTKKLWDLLEARRSVISKIPKDRFDVDEIYSADSSVPGKTISRYGAFLNNDVRAFDADFFGISPREAKSVDPLQRMILEVVYEALENADIASDSLKGSNTGVYIALGNSDYIQARFRSGNLDTVDVYDTTGIPFGTACGRVSIYMIGKERASHWMPPARLPCLPYIWQMKTLIKKSSIRRLWHLPIYYSRQKLSLAYPNWVRFHPAMPAKPLRTMRMAMCVAKVAAWWF